MRNISHLIISETITCKADVAAYGKPKDTFGNNMYTRALLALFSSKVAIFSAFGNGDPHLSTFKGCKYNFMVSINNNSTITLTNNIVGNW